MVLRILFAVMAPLRQVAGQPTSDLASARYRVVVPAQQLVRLGHQVQAVSIPEGMVPEAVRDARVDVLVLSKSFSAANQELARAMKARGVRVAVDYCDDHFDHPKHGSHFRALAAIGDVLVASSAGMAEAVRRNTAREALVIDDPVEGPRGVPTFSPGPPALRVLWFGHPANLGGILARIDELRALARTTPLRLTVVTKPMPGVAELLQDISRAARVDLGLVPWSTEATWNALRECDVAWIPVADSGQKTVKSANRLVEAVWAGRLAVADAIPAYQPFADLVPVGERLDAAIARCMADAAGTSARLLAAQRRVTTAHSRFECGRRWAAALGDAGDRPLRLHLACGQTILPGYVNVDAQDRFPQAPPDVVCDLDQLAPFADASVEEILCTQSDTPFWRTDLGRAVAEWSRVLEPGGRLLVECPGIAGSSRAPLAPDALAALLREAGLREVRQEPVRVEAGKRRARITATR